MRPTSATAARRRSPKLERESSGTPTWLGVGALASLDRRAWPPHAKRANSLAGEEAAQAAASASETWTASRPGQQARNNCLHRFWSLSRRVRRTPWRGRDDPPPIRLPRRRRGAPCRGALLLPGRRARLLLGGSRASQARASLAIAGACRALRIAVADRIGKSSRRLRASPASRLWDWPRPE
jgi:hypothetical protein